MIGALILLPIALHRKRLAQGISKPLWLLAFTLCEISAPWFLIGYAEQHVVEPAGWSDDRADADYCYRHSAWFFLNSVWIFNARAAWVLGLGGVVALLGFDDQSVQILPVLALCLSALGYAVGPIIVERKLSGLDTTAVLDGIPVVASLSYAPFVPAHWPEQFSLDASIAVVALALFCTVLAFQLLFALVSEVGPARATVITWH